MSRSFNGSNQGLQASSAPANAVPITMVAWVRSTNISSAATNGHCILQLGPSSGFNNQFRLQLGNGSTATVVANARTTSNAEAASSAAVPANDEWHHAAAVFSANNARAAYLDGSNKGTNTTSLTPSAGSIVRTNIGLRSDSNQDFIGQIAHAAIWSVALSDGEVAELAAGTSPLLIQPANLIFYAPFLGSESPDIDIIGSLGLTVSGASYSTEEPDLISGAFPSSVFVDDFARSDGGLGSGWTSVYGAPAIVSGEVREGTLDGDNMSLSLVSTSALPVVPSSYAVELDTSDVIDPSDEDSVFVALGTDLGGNEFAGLLIFFAGDYVSIWSWDDDAAFYSLLRLTPLTTAQGTGRKRVEVFDDSGSVVVLVYALSNNALICAERIESGSIPGYITEWRPGIGFSNPNATGTLWIDDVEITADTSDTTLSADAGDFRISGGAVNARAERRLSVAPGDLRFEGGDASLSLSKRLSADAGDFRIAGASVGLPLQRVLRADASVFQFSGGAMSLEAHRRLAVDAAEFRFQGEPVEFSRSYRIAADAGGFRIAGGAVNFGASRRLGADAGDYRFAGADVDLSVQSAAETVLDVDAGDLRFQGGAVSLRASRLLDADAGDLRFAGAAVDTLAARRLHVEPGDFRINGMAVDLIADTTTTLGADAGVFSLSGADVSLRADRRLHADAGALTFAGGDVDLSRDRVLKIQPGNFRISGGRARLRYSGEPPAVGGRSRVVEGVTESIVERVIAA